MRDGDWIAGLVGAVIFGGIAVLVILFERAIGWLWKRLFGSRPPPENNQGDADQGSAK